MTNLSLLTPKPQKPTSMVHPKNEKRWWLKWYKTAAWQRLRARQLRREPLCRMCRARKEITAATVADHIRPHRGDMQLFFDENNLQSLCAPDHNSAKQRLEKSGEFGCDEKGIVIAWK